MGHRYLSHCRWAVTPLSCHRSHRWSTATRVEVKVQLAQHALTEQLTLRPVRRWELWLLPHSHNDIGYTHVQTEVEQMQWRYLEEAVALARAPPSILRDHASSGMLK